MPKYLCSYCDVHLNFDSQSGRKQHNRGRKHQENVRGYYAQYAAALAGGPNAGMPRPGGPGGPGAPFGITMLGPGGPGGMRPPMMGGGHQPFHPYGAPGGPMGIRTLGPVPNMPGPPRPAPPSHLAPYGAAGMGGPPLQPFPGAPQQYRPPMPMQPQFMGAPPAFMGQQGPPQNLPPPSALPPPPSQAPSQSPPASADGPAKSFINPDRMRALGLQSHH